MITEWSIPTAQRAGPRPGGGPWMQAAAISLADPLSSLLPLRWHVLQTRSRQEKAVAEVLHDLGARPFLPLVRRTVHYGHRRRIVELPVFANYTFVWGTQEHAYLALKSRRVVRIVPVVDQPTLARDIEQIRLAIQGDAALSPYRFLERGVRARVTSGPFKDVEGLVVEDPRGTRLVLQIQALGRAMCLEIDACLLASVDELSRSA